MWHGLSWVVPVYGWFRYHAHIRQYKALMVERGVRDSLNVGLLTTVVVISTIGTFVAVLILDLVLPSDAARSDDISVASVMQSNLNRYWASVDSRLTRSARFGKGEVVCIILGVLCWLGIVADSIWS